MAYDFSKVVKIGNKILYKNGLVVQMKKEEPEPVIVLPPNTLRFRFSDSNTDPTSIENGGTWTKVTDSEFNDWDWTCNDTDWRNEFYKKLTTSLDPDIKIITAGDTSNVTDMIAMFYDCASLVSVPLFNTSNVTNMMSMFGNCTSLVSVPLFNTSNVTDMMSMFGNCTSLVSVPLFDTSNVTNMRSMFTGCTNVKSGALELYQRASVTGKVTSHKNTFTNCGKDTETGLAELQQIPVDWGGLAAG